ncbi:hypothetical protein [Moritella sp. F3]|uniref:hypothetical protein n=1 Tax=Moritella sp. F3 TaxID=2718882 RepID=UPI0018E1D129|nr:hypothetical protein [Moritella sp. F3]GIC77212.1 hypothetical protein FMO001_19390 [Moritella sp. F1]GIC82331.1 hypothetical protein FMO003_26120 [Moritella sp. F3]
MINNKHKLALSIVIAITTTGCANNVSSGKYSDQTTINSLAANNTSLNVSYIQNSEIGYEKTHLDSGDVNVQTPYMVNDQNQPEELYELAGLDTPVVNNSSVVANHTYNDLAKTSAESDAITKNTVTVLSPKVMLTKNVASNKSNNSRPRTYGTSSVSALSSKSKVVAAPDKVMSAEDKIRSLTINPFDYQHTPEFSYLTLNKKTDRVWMSIDDDKVKEYLLDKEWRLDPEFETESEKPVKPIAKVHFKVIKGSLKENLEALLSATKSTELVYSASLNHYFYNDFELEEDSVLKVIDRIIEPFKTPHQVVGMAYVNDILRAYSKNN